MLNIEQAKELKSSVLFGLYRSEIEHRIQLIKDEMEAAPVQKLGELQLRIKGLREAINVPQDVIDSES